MKIIASQVMQNVGTTLQLAPVIVLALPPLAISTVAPAAVHPPEVERQLAFLVADWTIEGYEKNYRETCSWYADRNFVVCETLNQTEASPQRSVSILGWSAADGATPSRQTR